MPSQNLAASGNKPGHSTLSLLEEAVAVFSTSRSRSVNAILRLREADPTGLALAAAKLLISTEEETSATKYLADLLTNSGQLSNLLTSPHILPIEVALRLALQLANFDPRLDVRLMHHVLANARDGITSIPDPEALRLLELIGAVSDCMPLAPSLVQFQRHSNERVRSKAALLLGRSNLNLTRVETLMNAPDGRMRANALECLWGHDGPGIRKTLWSATKDPCSRVVINALLGLCKAGDRKAYECLAELADATEPIVRAGAAWAMGETGDLEFFDLLDRLGRDEDVNVRAMAEKSMTKLHTVQAEPLDSVQSEPTEMEVSRDRAGVRDNAPAPAEKADAQRYQYVQVV